MAIELNSAVEVASKLGEKYCKAVLDRMPYKHPSTVRFGLTGTGVAPNYQIQWETGETFLYHGMGHSEWEDGVDEFKAGNISAAFTRQELYDAFKVNFRNERKTPKVSP